MDKNMQTKDKKTRRGGRVVFGFILLGLGVYLQLWSMDMIPDFDRTWPVFIIIVGLAIILGAFFKKKKPGDDQPS